MYTRIKDPTPPAPVFDNKKKGIRPYTKCIQIEGLHESYFMSRNSGDASRRRRHQQPIQRGLAMDMVEGSGVKLNAAYYPIDKSY